MAAYVGDLETRVRALEEMANHLHEAVVHSAEGQRELRARLERQAVTMEAQRTQLESMTRGHEELAKELRELTQAIMPVKEQLGRIQGRLEGKRETTALLVTAAVSALWLLISFLNLQVRLSGQ